MWYHKKHPIHIECKILYTVKYRLSVEASGEPPATWNTRGEDQTTGIMALGNTLSKYLFSWWEIIANPWHKRSHLIDKVK